MNEDMIAAENTPKVFQIVPENMPTLEDRLAKLNKKAAKLGCEPIIMTVVGEKMVTVYEKQDSDYDEYAGSNTPSSHLEKRILVTVTGKAPKLNGWAIAAVIEHTEAGNILRAVPPFATEAFGTQFRTSDPICEHCRFDRNRKDTYIVRNDDGRQAQVGRTCLKDFTGHKSPEMVASWAEIISQLDDMMDGFGNGNGNGSGIRYFTLLDVLEVAACVVRRDGFMSKAAANKIYAQSGDMVTTTSSQVAWLLSPTLGSGRKAQEEREAKAQYKVEDSDKAKAQSSLDWAAAMNPSEAQDYLWNLHVIANMEHITFRQFGLAVSMISAYQRELDRLAGIEYAKKAPRPVSQFVGTVGKREDFTVTLKRVVGHEGQFGLTTIHIMVDQNGNRLTWFKSGNAEMEEGHTYILKGTVKSHEVYHKNKDSEGNDLGAGENQTIISRCKIVREIAPEVAA